MPIPGDGDRKTVLLESFQGTNWNGYLVLDSDRKPLLQESFQQSPWMRVPPDSDRRPAVIEAFQIGYGFDGFPVPGMGMTPFFLWM